MSLFTIEFKDKQYMKKRQMVKENERVWKEIGKLHEHPTMGYLAKYIRQRKYNAGSQLLSIMAE